MHIEISGAILLKLKITQICHFQSGGKYDIPCETDNPGIFIRLTSGADMFPDPPFSLALSQNSI